MKKLFILIVLVVSITAVAQIPEHSRHIFPEGVTTFQNIPYANDTLKKHLLDIYLPAKAKKNLPLLIWVHGGGWLSNDKYADMGYMKNTIRAILEKGYALASIDYRHSTTAIFPAQIQDCNLAVQFLYDHASQYGFDRNSLGLIGFSAGGHLASLLALSNNHNIPSFYANGKKTSFKIKTVLDFYGPSNFVMFFRSNKPTDIDNPIAVLLGASPLVRPDLGALASPVTYVDKGDPSFFIIHGEKDDAVPPSQSYLLKGYLDLSGVPNELTVVKGAPHFGEMFDTEELRTSLMRFLEKNLPVGK
jgi:acetyl esterase/lipase